MAFAIFAFCISLLQDYNAFNNGTLDARQKLNSPGNDFYWYASQKYEWNVTKNDTDACMYNICGDPSYYYHYYDLSRYPEEVTKGFLKNDAEEIEKSRVALIEQIALDSNYNLTAQELEICLDVSLSF